MCSCPAHNQLVDCACLCDHTNDRLLQWKARALRAEAKVSAARKAAAAVATDPLAQSLEDAAAEAIRGATQDHVIGYVGWVDGNCITFKPEEVEIVSLAPMSISERQAKHAVLATLEAIVAAIPPERSRTVRIGYLADLAREMLAEIASSEASEEVKKDPLGTRMGPRAG